MPGDWDLKDCPEDCLEDCPEDCSGQIESSVDSSDETNGFLVVFTWRKIGLSCPGTWTSYTFKTEVGCFTGVDGGRAGKAENKVCNLQIQISHFVGS